jgi:hypothetical protein
MHPAYPVNLVTLLMPGFPKAGLTSFAACRFAGYPLNAQGFIVGPVVGEPQGKPAASQLRSVPDKVYPLLAKLCGIASSLEFKLNIQLAVCTRVLWYMHGCCTSPSTSGANQPVAVLYDMLQDSVSRLTGVVEWLQCLGVLAVADEPVHCYMRRWVSDDSCLNHG